MNKEKVITVRVTDEMREHIESECRERNLKKSDYIRELIEIDRDKNNHG